MLWVRCSVKHDLQGKRQGQVDDSVTFCILALFGILGCIAVMAILKLAGVLK